MSSDNTSNTVLFPQTTELFVQSNRRDTGSRYGKRLAGSKRLFLKTHKNKFCVATRRNFPLNYNHEQNSMIQEIFYINSVFTVCLAPCFGYLLLENTL